jgi:hypothetical protein
VLDNETGLYEPWKKDGRPGVPAGTYIMDGIKAVARSGKNERDGFMGVLQYRPNKQWTSMIDVYASEFRREETANQIEINLSGWNGNNTPAFGYTNANVVAARWPAPPPTASTRWYAACTTTARTRSALWLEQHRQAGRLDLLATSASRKPSATS